MKIRGMIENPFSDDQEKTRDQKEYKFQIAVVDWLYGRTRKGNKTFGCNPPMPGLLFTHHYAGRKGSSEGFFLQQLGVRPGMGDLLNWWNTGGTLNAGMLELKVDADMSAVQHKIKGVCLQIGIKYEMARNPEEVIGAYRNWGLKPLHTAILAPDYRTDMEKKHDAFDFFAP